MNWYLKVLKQYADFNGRARRKEYWMFTLFHIIIIFLLVFIIGIGGTNESFNSPLFYLIIIYVLATIIPTIAVTVRRLHDIGKSGYWYFITFIPYIGSFWLLFLTCKDSITGSNEWGDNPKGIGNDQAISEIGLE
ncbi:DUF805 domain-containing protein [Tenacibaculum sp. IB213877]|uniref:DUF805 domain-containing protein n=1 Tax=Tenacibaculum sp. IB213877 TaxID=3097351 RepID=UPI002A5A8FB3|nr:DUF805 domain-containing protein [Tenacibaculum sp. IB213877]MDY0779637.1 DUF805 domain-containing protein [Tenacibaculum sp. IB213877]